MRHIVSSVAVAVLVFVTGCSAENQQPDYRPILDFQTTTIEGQAFSGSDLEGENVLVWFWTPWCSICVQESNDIRELSAQYPDVRFIGIAGYGSAAEMQDFVERTSTAHIVHLNDATGELWIGFAVPIQPSVVTLTKSGSATLRVGPSTRSDLEALLSELVS